MHPHDALKEAWLRADEADRLLDLVQRHQGSEDVSHIMDLVRQIRFNISLLMSRLKDAGVK